MDKDFLQDEWTSSFCMIFNELVARGRIIKKKNFVADIDLGAQSTLNHILGGTRNFPLEKRQYAMAQLRDKYRVNMEYFRSRSNPMFVVNVAEDEEVPYGKGKNRGGITYSELVECRRIKEENEVLKKTLADKQMIIQTQAALIHQLQGQKG